MKSEGSRGVIHVALFTPKASLDQAGRDALNASLAAALEGIPLIRRARVARRLTLGRPYDQLSPPFDYLVLLEFDSEDDLRAYLDHPAHEALGRHFYESSDAAAAWDFRETGRSPDA